MDNLDEQPSKVMDIHNVKPRDVSKNALKWEKSNKIIHTTSKIFTTIPFKNLELHPFLVDLLQSPNDGQKKGFNLSTCTTIQAKSVPLNITKRTNVLMKSQTGSGKTLAYLLPVINELMTMQPPIQREDGTRALIIAPTRELCNQIADVISKLTQCCVRIVSGCISGGEKRKSEKARLRKGVVVLVSTPGRLLDHIRYTESFNLTNLKWIIMDEVDRLLDMGFEQTILEILSRIRGEKLPGLKDENLFSGNENTYKGNLEKKYHQQTLVLKKKVNRPEELRYLMASATLTNAVKQLAWPIMGSFNKTIGFCVVDGDTGHISTIQHEDDLYFMKPDANNDDDDDDDSDDEAAAATKEKGTREATTKENRSTLLKGETIDAPTRLSQYSMLVPCKWRLSALLSFLYLRRHQKIIVFFATCDSVDYHALLMKNMEWPKGFDSMNFTPKGNPHDSSSKNNQGGAGGSAGNQFTFSSFDEVDWKEHAALFDGAMTESQQKGQSLEGEQLIDRVISRKNKIQTTVDPLNYKFTGLFGEKCPLFRLHGKVPQSIRKLVYKEFFAAKSGILLCTDVAARGLDMPRVDYILQYDPPCETSDYVHRIGRTARCGLAGSALLFLLPSEQMYLNLLSSYGMSLEPLSLSSMFQEVSKEIPGINAKKFKNYDEITSVIIQKTIEILIENNKYLQMAGVQAYNSFLRSYTTHSADTKGIFKINLLHLGHVAKSFGLKEKPKEFNNSNKNSTTNDIIGRIFNGEFSSKEFKAALLPKKSNQVQEDNDDEDEDEDEGESSKKKNKKTNNNKKVEETKKRKRSDDSDDDEEEEEDEEPTDQQEADHPTAMELSDSEGDEDEEDDENEKKPKGKKAQAAPAASAAAKTAEKKKIDKAANKKAKTSSTSSPSTSSAEGSEFGLGKRKLAFGDKSKSMGHNGKKKSLTASGKFRKGGSYFRKKLRTQMSSEFSAN